ncbi:hypothetical protein AcV7_005197 [Taiwanofungus camphoratus]|nr:hypothetical protein AcV7_005197 [Antrodia cinnamomea]
MRIPAPVVDDLVVEFSVASVADHGSQSISGNFPIILGAGDTEFVKRANMPAVSRRSFVGHGPIAAFF